MAKPPLGRDEDRTELRPDELSDPPADRDATLAAGELDVTKSRGNDDDDATLAREIRGTGDAITYSPGEVLGERYRILGMLGRGGMGEVWRAYDLKLHMDVALKSLLAKLAGGDLGLRLLRGEVRTAREVISPNVCRLYDLVEIDGYELVSMEYIDGTTLLDLLEDRGPLQIQEASEIGSQFLAGLEAIHQAGLVHRDIKPENIMLTRSGRVVIMDFGLTAPSGTGDRSGTPAYMAPEQHQGEGTDARADVFSAGMVLAEMLSAVRGPDKTSRQTFWKNVRHDPPELPETPWSRILGKAVAADREERYASAQELARILEEVAFRVEGAEHKTPYPGLASFSEEGAEFFFGREAEVEKLWTKLQQSYLLGVIGASGAGKSSFLRAGVLPVKPEGWAHLDLKPGTGPFAALGRALGVDLHDPVDSLVALRRWREQNDEALLIVDQFEELFTQNPQEVQESFVSLLQRAAFDADVHVLLSMRDDFLIQCQRFPALEPMFSELTLLGPPVGAALRRGLVQPALKCGYRFEDEGVVEEMLAEVTRERGALPLIAFTAAKLWEERDQESGFLTREAYDRLGGVGGALAQHAETTLEQVEAEVGAEGQSIVRELFRNLVTARGTRANMEVGELLSVFDDTQSAHTRAGLVLQSLIDARLLTSYEVRESDNEAQQLRAESHRRVEVVHESLLSAWPRLVRWRTQDADLVQRRDELRQAARLWDSRDRSEDLLWSGAAFREFQVWRERYSGRLTAIEDAFAAAMVERAGRVQRRRRNALAVAIVFLLAVIAGMTTLWRQSERSQAAAKAQTLIAYGQLELDRHSTAALAWATKSLELSDSPEARELSVRALWRGPPMWKLNDFRGAGVRFSADGERLLESRGSGDAEHFWLWSADGAVEPVPRLHDGGFALGEWLDQANTILHLLNPNETEGETDERGEFTGGFHQILWSLPEGRRLLERFNPVQLEFSWDPVGRRLIALTLAGELLAQSPGDAGGDRVLGRLEFPATLSVTPLTGTFLDQAGHRAADIRNDEVVVFGLGESGLSAPVVLGRHQGVTSLAIDEAGQTVATRDDSGEIRIWKVDTVQQPQILRGAAGPPARDRPLQFSSDGTLLQVALAGAARGERRLFVWSLARSPGGDQTTVRELGTFLMGGAEFHHRGQQLAFPVSPGGVRWMGLHSPDGTQAVALPTDIVRGVFQVSMTPDGRWLAANVGGLRMWSLARSYPMVVKTSLDQAPGRRASRTTMHVAKRVIFDRQGRWFTYAVRGEGIYRWPLEGLRAGEPFAEKELLLVFREGISTASMSPDGDQFVLGNRAPEGGSGPLFFSARDGAEVWLKAGFGDEVNSSVFSEDGRLVAAMGGQFFEEESKVKVWDTQSRELVATLDPEERIMHGSLGLTADNDVLWASRGGLWQGNLETGEIKRLPVEVEGIFRAFSNSADGRRLVVRVGHPGTDRRTAMFLDTTSGETVPLETHGTDVRDAVIDLAGNWIATLDGEGVIRVGSPEGEEPHLLYAHPGAALALDPLGRWVVSADDSEIRLWPMPDLSQPPLHTLPREELLEKLRSLTNLRILADPESPIGWGLDYEPFPGWRHDPNW